MDDKFDKDLANRIREVFDNYEHPPADEGWVQLRKKFPAGAKDNKLAWLWRAGAAAVLLVFLGLGLWVITSRDKPVKTMAYKPAKQQIKTPAENHKAPEVKTNITPESAIAQANPQQSDTKQNYDPALKNYPGANYPINRRAEATIDTGVSDRANNVAAVTDLNEVNKQANPVTTAKDSQITVSNNVTGQQIAKNEQPVVAGNTTLATQPQRQPAKTIVDLLNGEKTNAVAKKQTPEKQDDKKVNFSIYAATYFNYAQGSANQINAGAGFTSDIKLSNNIKLSTGVALAQNSLNYRNGLPPGESSNLANTPASAVVTRQNGLFTANALTPVFKNYNAVLIGLDIPLNIKYEFNPQKNDTYISAGLSSGTFIDERYTYRYSYNNNNITSSSTTTDTENETTAKSFNSFYFGKTLNVSFGIGYPLGKSNRLIIEPFLKYPLDGLGAQQIRFGAGGLNLKINFKGSKR